MARKNETALQFSSIPCDLLHRKSVRRAVRMAEREGRDSGFKAILLSVITYLWMVLHGSPEGYYADCSVFFVSLIKLELLMIFLLTHTLTK